MTHPLIIIGAGGHAAVVADALLACGHDVLGFTDTDHSKYSAHVCGLPVLGGDEVLATRVSSAVWLVNGIGGVGSCLLRQKVQCTLEAAGWRFATVCHPTAVVSPRAQIGEGAQLLAGSVVQVGAEIGRGCIVNTGAVVEHDCTLGEYVHVAPRSLLCGDVRVGARSHIGAGAVVRQRVRLGEETVVGAGAVVVKDFPGGCTLLGIPARRVEPKP